MPLNKKPKANLRNGDSKESRRTITCKGPDLFESQITFAIKAKWGV